MFKPAVICLPRSIEQRLAKEWERAKLAANNKLSKKQKAELDNRLDSLLDPLHCTCQPILLYAEAVCMGPKADPPCRLGAHLPSC